MANVICKGEDQDVIRKSRTSGGGHRITETVKSSDAFGGDRTYTKTTDVDKGGRITGRTKTDSNGNIWNVNSSGAADRKIGNDGRHKR